jgi:PadR family transcriptional regulator, regulatory protein PadR
VVALVGYRVLVRWAPVPGAGVPGRDVPFMDVRQNLVPLDRASSHDCREMRMAITYVVMTAIDRRMLDRELKKGSAELIILSIVEPRARHGYEINKLIETQSAGQLKFHVASLYPLLYRLEERGWLNGRWVEKPGQRRRRFYSLTSEGRRVLTRQRDTWKTFVHAMGLITGVDHA